MGNVQTNYIDLYLKEGNRSTHNAKLEYNKKLYEQCPNFEIVTYNIKYNHQYSYFYRSYFCITIDDFEDTTLFEYFNPESKDHLIDKIEIYYWLFKPKNPLIIVFTTNNGKKYHYKFYYLIWANSLIYNKLITEHFNESQLKDELIKENNDVNKKFTLKVGSGVNIHILTINDVVSGENADLVLFKKIIFIPKRDTTKSGNPVLYTSTLLSLQNRDHGFRYHTDFSYLIDLNEQKFNGVVVYYTGKHKPPENIPVLIEFYNDCNKIQFCKKDKDWFYWEKKTVSYWSSIGLEAELLKLKQASDSYDKLTYDLDNKKNYSNVGVSLDTESTSHYSVYSHTPTDQQLTHKKTTILIKNQEIKMKDGKKYEKILFDVSTYFLISNTGMEDNKFFLIKFIETDEEGYVGTPAYYTKNEDSEETWTQLDILFNEAQERLGKILELEFYGSDFKNMRNDAYNILNEKPPITFKKRSSATSVSHKDVRVISIGRDGRPMVQISPHQIKIEKDRASTKPHSREKSKGPKCATISHIPEYVHKDDSNLTKVIVLLLEKQCSYGDNDVSMALKQSSLDPKKCRILNQTTIVTGISTEGTRQCVDKYGFNLIQHYFINLNEIIKKVSYDVELKVFIRNSYSSDNFSELKLYKTDTDTTPIKLDYKRFNDDFYVYFYGNDPRPLLFYYDGKTYRPNSIFDYYKSWIHVPEITDFSCDKDRSTKLLDKLSEIVGILNVVHLRQSQLFTYAGANGDETQNTLIYAVHEFEDKHVLVKLTHSKTRTYSICTHVPYGIDGDGDGFRLGIITYDGTTNTIAKYDMKRQLVYVAAYYSLNDKNLERPLMLDLGYKPEIIAPELSYYDYFTELEPEDYKLIPDIKPYFTNEYHTLQPPLSSKPPDTPSLTQPPIIIPPQVKLPEPRPPPTKSKPDLSATKGTQVTHKPVKPDSHTPHSKPSQTPARTIPPDKPAAAKPTASQGPAIKHTLPPVSSPAPRPEAHPPVQPESHSPAVIPFPPFQTQTPSDPNIVHEFHQLDSTNNDRWLQTEHFDGINIEKSLKKIEDTLQTKTDKQRQAGSSAKDDGESTNITLIGGSVGGGVAGVGLIGGGAVAAVKYPFLLIPSIKPLL
ncbi:conserved hypothetical protein [Theileria orientalis strain Shintoku]|uniref:Uncharacterized protein n=1 Tax=Theileria orientalis strain Shintoku TaxID=869250 RepID=J4D5K3_THEOR|nr:conserved hypothetical protein [Theileria orientalis strain Shintoku]BAM39020.1 conserved hypothetical protein [Theileria orientalis strain Shintoku]|eukprot:XP_009689321.1 conserved hypothetical protein [Theileria orientalis strain Shintoku]